MKLSRSDIELALPNVARDAPVALTWFTRPEGAHTLRLMGNNEEIATAKPSFNEQVRIIRSFLTSERARTQVTRMIIVDRVPVGVVWIERRENHNVPAPSIHIMIGNPAYRGRGIGRAVLEAAIEYARDVLHAYTCYSRYLVRNAPIAHLMASLGFVPEGPCYKDTDGVVWQLVRLPLQ